MYLVCFEKCAPVLNYIKGNEIYLELFNSFGTEVPLTDGQLHDLEVFLCKFYKVEELNFCKRR